MPVLSVGDQANTYRLRRLSVGLKTDLTRLGQELATGKKSDIGATVSGDLRPVASIERRLATLAAYKTSTAEIAQFLEGSQLALGSIQDMGRSLSPGLLTASQALNSTMIDAAAADGRQKFEAVVARFNASAAGRTMFGGAATDRSALASGKDMLAALNTAIAGSTTASDVVAAVDAWFDSSGGGFETDGYLGSQEALGPMMIAEGEALPFDLRADDQTVRDTLKGFALAAVAAEGALSGLVEERAQLLAVAAERLIHADGEVSNLRARIGAAEGRVEEARVQNAAENAANELARSALVSADPYETATALQAVQGQIEMLYTVTARIAGLRFSDYMR
ncbi:flagellin [Sinisalibacter lacisalsi]|uniref:Flagellin n=1 Tax=Sinisalibacter lacisalsi TaxID=1526570 RepID=A0ABQ1QCH4_9RHOB|nr:flagellin [Sinisalibacter lacisalsi]